MAGLGQRERKGRSGMNFLHGKGHVSPHSHLIAESESHHRVEKCKEMQNSTDVGPGRQEGERRRHKVVPDP